MIFEPATIAGSFVVSMQAYEDERGWFARAWCEEEFRAHGITARPVQTNASFSAHRGTIRGLHWQEETHPEAKFLRCIAGAVYDVAVDVRPDSPSFGAWQGIELVAGDRRQVYVPEGCAHGYQALVDGCEVSYNVSHAYAPQAERGLRWNDPAFSISWPVSDVIVSDKDAAWPDFEREGADAPRR